MNRKLEMRQCRCYCDKKIIMTHNLLRSSKIEIRAKICHFISVISSKTIYVKRSWPTFRCIFIKLFTPPPVPYDAQKWRPVNATTDRAIDREIKLDCLERNGCTSNCQIISSSIQSLYLILKRARTCTTSNICCFPSANIHRKPKTISLKINEWIILFIIREPCAHSYLHICDELKQYSIECIVMFPCTAIH